jgi:hypothetical protein
MAIVAAFQAGSSPVALNGGPLAALRLGASASLTSIAASAAATLPTDAAGNKYSSYLIMAAGAAVWFNFNTAGDAAVAGAANTFLLSPGAQLVVQAPPGATQISAIQDSATGKLSIVGIY